MEKKQKGALSLDFGLRGWIVIIYCFVAFVVGGAFLGVWQIIITTNTTTLGWNSTALFSLVNISGVIMCVMNIVISRLMMNGKVSLAKISTAMIGIFAVVCILMRFTMGNVYSFNALFMIGYIMINAQGLMINGALVGNWWPKRRGMVIGITTIGIPLGSAFGTGLYNFFAALFGTQNVLLIYGVISIAVTLIGLFLVRDFPEEVGCYPDNDVNESREQLEEEFRKMRESMPRNAWNLKRILTTRYTWIIILAGFTILLANGLFSMQHMNRLTVIGDFTLNEAIQIRTVACLIALIGSPFSGVIDAKFGSKKMGIFLLILCIITTILQLPGTYMCTLIGMILFGVVMGGGSNLLVTLASDSWPRESSSRAFSIMHPITQLMQSGVAQIFLLVANATQTYMPIYIFFIALCVFTMILFIVSYNSKNIRDLDAKFKAQDAAAGIEA